MSKSELAPMLAKEVDLSKLRYPVWVQPKFDGIRMLVKNGVGLSRSLKPIPNQSVQRWVARNAHLLDGLDGELIVGPVTAQDVFQRTTSGVMSSGGEPDFKFYVFDFWNIPEEPYKIRKESVRHWFTSIEYELDRVMYVQDWIAHNEEGVIASFEHVMEEGYEGAIIRHADGKYKYGRSTVNEGYLLKYKDFHDAEGRIIGFEELMHNDNEATIDNLGHTKRSSHKAGKRPGGVLGKLVVELPKSLGWKESEVRIGTGFDAAQRRAIWDNRDYHHGRLVTYKYQKVGSKDAPRTPVFKGFRDPADTDTGAKSDTDTSS